MEKIEHGNVNTKTNGDRGWIMGHFKSLLGTPFHTENFEIKWSKHAKGEFKPESKANKVAKTITILISGKFKIVFPESDKSHTLEKEGDYVFWDSGVIHSWETLEDSFIISVRWPSLQNDQM